VFTNRTSMLGSAALALVVSLAVAREAHAQGWRVHVRAGVSVGTYAPPPPVYYPAPPVVVVRPYYPPPPVRVVHYQPAPVYVAPAPAAVVVERPGERGTIGLAVSGLAQLPADERDETGGVAVTAHILTSPHAMLLGELQVVGAPRGPDGLRRRDLAGLVGARLLPWTGDVAPFVEVAGGLGEATFYCCGQELHSEQLVGRYALGLELRLGPHLVFEGQMGKIHRLTYDTEDPVTSPESQHTSAFELRGGVALRF
jgi:hypothetical protein